MFPPGYHLVIISCVPKTPPLFALSHMDKTTLYSLFTLHCMIGQFFTSEIRSHSVVSDSLRLHGILQARITEWVAFPFSRGSSQPRDQPGSPSLKADSLPAEPQGKLFSQTSFFCQMIFLTDYFAYI